MQSWRGNNGKKPLNRIDLPSNLVKHCSDMPESGMGYQKVAIKIKTDGGDRVIGGIVLNCSILETVEQVLPENILDISLA